MNEGLRPSSAMGRVAATHLQIASAVLLVALVAMVVFHRRPGAGHHASVSQSAGEAPQTASKDYLPLAVGNHWRYRTTTVKDNGRTSTHEVLDEIIQRREGDWFRLIGEVNGSQKETRLLAPTAEGVQEREYESSRTPSLFLPAGDLMPGQSWQVSKLRRARVESEARVQVGEREVDALKIKVERYFDRDYTDDVGWYPEAWIWVARGIGVVRRDDTGAKDPVRRPIPGHETAKVSATNTLLELESYELKTSPETARKDG